MSYLEFKKVGVHPADADESYEDNEWFSAVADIIDAIDTLGEGEALVIWKVIF